jgi:sugar phosphate isomerase/epimerase
MGTPHLSPHQAIDFFARVGLDAIELICDPYFHCAITHQISPADRRELRSRADAAGLTIGCLTPYIKDFAVPDTHLRQAAVASMKRYVDLAHELRCPNIRILAGHEVAEEDRPAFLPRLVESLRTIGDAAQQAGVNLVIENHMDTMAITATQTVEVVRTARHPAVAILYDQPNLITSNAEPFQDAFALQKPFIRHVHVKDQLLVRGRKLAAVLGTGTVPWPQILPLLHAMGYQGFLTLEYEMRWFPTGIPSPEVGFVEGAKYLRGLVADLDARQ